MTQRPQSAAGFTLVEALVALALVAMVVINYIGIRTSSLIDATYARNWRLAREIAEQKMSELKAGAREVQATSGEEMKLENYSGFSYVIVFGESEVADLEARIASDASGSDEVAHERQDWQRSREDYRKAQSRGLSATEYQESKSEDVNKRLSEKAPSTTDFEEVAVAVYFPKIEPQFEGQRDALLIKARLSTLAISCMTPDQAAAVATAKGETQNQKNAAGGQSPGGGNSTSGGSPASSAGGSPSGGR